MIKNRAVVFAYHNVGVRCLQVLLARGVDVALVVTHQDNSDETIWFDSVAQVAAEHGIPVITPENPKDPALFDAVCKAMPDFIFSFYYRHMLPVHLLAVAPRGAYNMHGSLLPRYRGRVPVNWAVLNGETETGATLHEMAAKPDAGAIIGQAVVPILPDDTSHQVFEKVTVAAEQVLWAMTPLLLNDTAPRIPNDVNRGSYFGGRKPEDGRIDWSQTAQQVYNLVRAVAPPYPGAFFDVNGKRYVIAESRLSKEVGKPGSLPLGLRVADNRILGICGDGGALWIKRLLCREQEIDQAIDQVITPKELTIQLQSS